jgi:hypothetical protein
MALFLNDFALEIADIAPGETIRVNHGVYCDAGVDNRQRLYLTRTVADPTVTIGYCHNCGQGGNYIDKTYAQFRNQRHDSGLSPLTPTETLVEKITPPPNMLSEIDRWPTHAQAWAYKNRLRQYDADTYNIKFDVSSDRVYLPQYEHISLDGEGPVGLEGYQLRCTNGIGPKYVTVRESSPKGYTHIVRYGSEVGTLVIVEDLCSGIAIMKAPILRSTAVAVNYGVSINPLVVHLAASYDTAVVWLDNDSAFIRNRAEHIARTIALYSSKTDVAVVQSDGDPKHHEPDRIRQELESLWTR